MSFLTPLFLLLGLLALPVIVLYMLRLRRQEMVVSSTLLWRQLLRDREANAPWQRLRRNLLLLLQLLILAALVLALARPFLPVPSIVSGNVVVLLDSSASMQATDVEPDRFTAAKAEITRLINDLGGGDQMTLIQVGRSPVVLASATGDHDVLRRALADARASNGPADWPAAFALANGAAQGFRDARIVIVSDGGIPAGTPPLAAEAVYVPVGESRQNLAITALATRPTETGAELFASVHNYGDQEQTALLSLGLDGVLFDSRRVSPPAGGSVNVTWNLPEDAAVIEARLSDHQPDYLSLDDAAWAVHEGGLTNRVLLVTEGNIFLEQILGLLPGVALFKTTADGQPPTTEGEFDLYVFDGVALPDPPPAADLLIVNPQGENELFQVTGAFTDTTTIRLADSPLLQYVEWGQVQIRRAQAVEAAWGQHLVAAEGGPLLLAGERDGYRLAMLTFDLHDSDLPLRIAFPVLMANLIGWLTPGRAFDAPARLQSGDPVALTPGASTTAVTVQKPDGTAWSAGVGEGQIIFGESDQLGLYRLTLRDDAGERPAGAFAVNLFAPEESQLQPAAEVRLGQTAVASSEREDVGQRELWPWLAAVALIILIVEWWVYYRPALGRLRLTRH